MVAKNSSLFYHEAIDRNGSLGFNDIVTKRGSLCLHEVFNPDGSLGPSDILTEYGSPAYSHGGNGQEIA